jgi:hypothetical protein
MYTSGCPKNQKICWNNKKSPPALTVKKAVEKCLSAISIIKPAVNIGLTIISKRIEIKIANKEIGNNSLW